MRLTTDALITLIEFFAERAYSLHTVKLLIRYSPPNAKSELTHLARIERHNFSTRVRLEFFNALLNQHAKILFE